MQACGANLKTLIPQTALDPDVSQFLGTPDPCPVALQTFKNCAPIELLKITSAFLGRLVFLSGKAWKQALLRSCRPLSDNILTLKKLGISLVTLPQQNVMGVRQNEEIFYV
jgi:hypothetical protein